MSNFVLYLILSLSSTTSLFTAITPTCLLSNNVGSYLTPFGMDTTGSTPDIDLIDLLRGYSTAVDASGLPSIEENWLACYGRFR